jgi:hypothetical protein
MVNDKKCCRRLMRTGGFLAIVALLLFSSNTAAVAQAPSFDGRPWNISTGNLSVTYVQGSPVGAFPKPDFLEAPPSIESLVQLKNMGLVADEDYIAWGAVEREPGKWDWRQHDAMEKALHKAGLKYVVYNWPHFPPVWLRNQPANRTLLKCLEHGEETNYLSVFDPRTIEWYDHFYKNVHDHFGDRVDDIYACVLGPYGEGNYPLAVPDWINMGHCHEGYWCADEYAIKAFQTAMEKKYGDIAKLNAAWGTHLDSFKDVRPPQEISRKDFKPSLAAFPSAQDKRRWLDFITWYHQAIIDFAEQSLKTVLKYYPASKVRLKPGGNAGGVNPLPWGTYCPGYARMAKGYGVVLQPADCQGAVFADKWMGTAYQFYGVTESTEPASALDQKSFVRRIFSDASAGAKQFFTYEFEQHVPDIHKYIHLITGKPGETEVAVYCPTTLYRLGANLGYTIQASNEMRDVCDYDVLDEALIMDGALTPQRYKALVIYQAEVVDSPVLEKFADFKRAGGRLIVVGSTSIQDLAGNNWADSAKVERIDPPNGARKWRPALAASLQGLKGVDGKLDGVWTCRRGKQVFAYNSLDKPATAEIDGKPVQIAPNSIYVYPDHK